MIRPASPWARRRKNLRGRAALLLARAVAVPAEVLAALHRSLEATPRPESAASWWLRNQDNQWRRELSREMQKVLSERLTEDFARRGYPL